MIVKNVKTKKTDKRIDNEIVQKAHDENAWDAGVDVKPHSKPTSIRLSARTIERAKLFAKVHRERGYQTWIKKIIEERVNTEYELYIRLKKELV